MFGIARNSKGFTLIEIIIAMGLSSLLLLVLYSVYFSINRTVEAAGEGQDVRETERVLIELLKRDLRGTVLEARYPFVSRISDVAGVRNSNLQFASTSMLGTNRFGVSKVGYNLVKTDKGEPVLLRQESDDPWEDLARSSSGYEISRIVTSFRLSFYSGAEWVEEWDSKASKSLPSQIRIALTIDDGKGNTREIVTDESLPGGL